MNKDIMHWSGCTDPAKMMMKLFECHRKCNLGQYSSCPLFCPKINFSETERHYELRAELPGVCKHDIKIELYNNVLTLMGLKIEEKKEDGKYYHSIESSHGEFRREFVLSKPVEKENIIAKFRDGVLHVILPKSCCKSTSSDIRIE